MTNICLFVTFKSQCSHIHNQINIVCNCKENHASLPFHLSLNLTTKYKVLISLDNIFFYYIFYLFILFLYLINMHIYLFLPFAIFDNNYCCIFSSLVKILFIYIYNVFCLVCFCVLCQYYLLGFFWSNLKLQNKYVKHNICQYQKVMEELVKLGN